MATLADLVARTRVYIPDDYNDLAVTNIRETSVALALEKLSIDLPYIVAAEATGNPVGSGSGETLDLWDPRCSKVVDVEWPVIAPPGPRFRTRFETLIDPDDQLEKVRLPIAVPSVATPAIVRYTALWTVSTLPSCNEEILVVKAAQILAEQLAGAYGATTDLELVGQIIHSGDQKAQTYATRAIQLKILYGEMLARTQEGPVA